MSNTRVVYSDDPRDQIKCNKCGKLKSDWKCVAQEFVDENQLVVKFRIEKNGRGGKIVTVLDGFPKNEEYLKNLTKELKAKCGVGGTHAMGEKFGMIEIQGDKRDQIKKILDAKKIKHKGM